MASPTKKTTRKIETKPTKIQQYVTKASKRTNPMWFVVGGLGVVGVISVIVALIPGPPTPPPFEPLELEAAKLEAAGRYEEASRELEAACKLIAGSGQAEGYKSKLAELRARIAELRKSAAAVLNVEADWAAWKARLAALRPEALKEMALIAALDDLLAALRNVLERTETHPFAWREEARRSRDEIVARIEKLKSNRLKPWPDYLAGVLTPKHGLGDREVARWGPAIQEARADYLPRARLEQPSYVKPAEEGVAVLLARGRDLLSSLRNKARQMQGRGENANAFLKTKQGQFDGAPELMAEFAGLLREFP